MSTKRLTLTLFRSLLRFTRQPHVVQSKFTLNPAEYRLEDRLPSSIHHIRNHTGVYGTISYLFRRSQLIDTICVAKNRPIWTESERIDVCLDAIKKLNQLSIQLKERHLQRIKNSAFEVYSRAVYRIGQSLHHIPSGCRCVVVGWDVNLTTVNTTNSPTSSNPAERVQRIQCVFDEEDSAELRGGASLDPTETLYDIADFRPITDPLLVRVKHHSLRLYFTHFDKAIGRFMPTEDLAFKYPFDGPYNSFDSRKRKEAMVNRGSAEQPSQQQQPQQQAQGSEQAIDEDVVASAAAKSVLRRVAGLGDVMVNILAKHLRHHTELSPSSSPASTAAVGAAVVGAAAAAVGASSSAADQDVKVKQMVQDIMGDICLLVDRCRRCNDHTSNNHNNSNNNNNNNNNHSNSNNVTGAGNVTNVTDDSVITRNRDDRFISWRINAEENMLLGIDHHPSSTSSVSGAGAGHGQEGLNGLTGMWHKGSDSRELDRLEWSRAKEEAKAVDALDSLMACFKGVDQMLQLRFQGYGIGHFETLMSDPSRSSTSATTPTTPSTPSASLDSSAVDAVTWMSPPVVFEVGQVVRHKRFGYRCVINGWDQRPLQDVRHWEGVVGTKLGPEQPFYRVIPDEGDVEKALGEGVFRSSFYVAQENLEAIEATTTTTTATRTSSSTTTSATDHATTTFDPSSPPHHNHQHHNQHNHELLINHRHLSFYFPHFDLAKGRFHVPYKLLFCFPPQSPSTSTSQPSAAASSSSPSPAASRPSSSSSPSESLAMSICEQAMLDLYFTLKSSLARTNTSSPQTLLQTLMQQSSSTAPSHPHDLCARDMFALLRSASGPLVAFHVEAALWQVWMSHPNPLINQAMRVGVSSLRRGDTVTAHDCFMECIRLDPTYPEAHNKLAAMYHKAEQYEECIRSAQTTLALAPSHYGALAGLGMSREKTGDISGAEKAFRSALSLHPWASHVPTVLWSLLLDQQDKINDQQRRESIQTEDNNTSTSTTPTTNLTMPESGKV